MFSLQLTVLNLHSTRNQHVFVTEKLCMRFGNLQSDIDLIQGFGGKRIFFEMQNEELKNLLEYYAFGLFIKLKHQQQSGRYFCLLSLEKISINDSLEHFKVYFKDQQRNIRLQGQIQLIIKEQPNAFAKRLPRFGKTVENDPISLNKNNQNLGLKQLPNYQNKTLSSFLYRTQAPKNPQMNKTLNHKGNGGNPNSYYPSPYEAKKKNNKKAMPRMVDKKNIKIDNYEGQSDQEINPPMMQFTNDTQDKMQKIFEPKIPTLMDFQHVQQANKTTQSFNAPLKKTNQQIKYQNPVNKQKQQLRQLANQFYETNMKKHKNQIMIPILQGDNYKLVSLQGLTNEQIIQYVQKNKQKQKQMLNKKNNQSLKKQKQYPLPPQRLGHNKKKDLDHVRPSSSLNYNEKKDHNVRNSIQQELSSNQNYEQDYQSDFQSMSIANSAIKSRARSNSIVKKSGNELQESIGDYSQEFQSYSQSQISKSHGKKYPHTYSEISQSFEQSLRK